jgi:hypothetical protein
VPFGHYKEIAVVLHNMINATERLVRANEEPGLYTQQDLLTNILPECKEAIQRAQVELNTGETAKSGESVSFLLSFNDQL